MLYLGPIVLPKFIFSTFSIKFLFSLTNKVSFSSFPGCLGTLMTDGFYSPITFTNLSHHGTAFIDSETMVFPVLLTFNSFLFWFWLLSSFSSVAAGCAGRQLPIACIWWNTSWLMTIWNTSRTVHALRRKGNEKRWSDAANCQQCSIGPFWRVQSSYGVTFGDPGRPGMAREK